MNVLHGRDMRDCDALRLPMAHDVCEILGVRRYPTGDERAAAASAVGGHSGWLPMFSPPTRLSNLVLHALHCSRTR